MAQHLRKTIRPVEPAPTLYVCNRMKLRLCLGVEYKHNTSLSGATGTPAISICLRSCNTDSRVPRSGTGKKLLPVVVNTGDKLNLQLCHHSTSVSATYIAWLGVSGTEVCWNV